MLDGDIPVEASSIQGDTLMVKFDRQTLIGKLVPGIIPLTVTGDIDGGPSFTGTDTINVI